LPESRTRSVSGFHRCWRRRARRERACRAIPSCRLRYRGAVRPAVSIRPGRGRRSSGRKGWGGCRGAKSTTGAVVSDGVAQSASRDCGLGRHGPRCILTGIIFSEPLTVLGRIVNLASPEGAGQAPRRAKARRQGRSPDPTILGGVFIGLGCC